MSIENVTRDEGREHALASWRHMFSSGRLNAWLREGPNDTLDPHLEAFVKLVAAERKGRPVKLLDVGSGPISMFSKNFSGWNVEISAADALGEDYDKLMNEMGLDKERKLVRPVQADCENLSSVLGEMVYDFVVMRNALDHTEDPMVSFNELMRVCAQGGYVLIEHFENEAKMEKWSGFHQWNLWYQKSSIWLQGKNTDPIDLIQSTSVPYRVVKVWRSKRTSGKDWCGAFIQKL